MDVPQSLFLLAAAILAWGAAADWRPCSGSSALLLVGCWLATIAAAFASLLAYAEALVLPR